jgi:hypothetical protein
MSWTSWNQILSPPTSDANVNAIINASGITYNYELPFQNYIDFSFDPTQAAGAATNASALTSLQQQCVRNALNYVHNITGINFNEIPAGSSLPQELVFVNSSNTGTNPNGTVPQEGVFTEYPTVTTNASGAITALNIKNTIAFNTSFDSNLQAGSSGYEALLQGIGEALGLTVPVAGYLTNVSDNDSSTLMDQNLTGNNYSTYQTMDIKALNWLYGGDGLLGQYGLTVNASGVPVANGGPPGGVIVSSVPSNLLAQTG